MYLAAAVSSLEVQNEIFRVLVTKPYLILPALALVIATVMVEFLYVHAS